jgi:dCTP deaminase
MLTHDEIIKQVNEGRIVIEPFDINCVGTNSYDVHLGDKLLVYDCEELDCKKNNPVKEIMIPEEGYVLKKGEFYLGTTVEKTRTDFHIPEINGKSSVGRLGISVHITAGFGDIGFDGKWTLEITAEKDVRVYRGMRIAQLIFNQPFGNISHLYREKKDAKYAVQEDVRASEMYKNFQN